MTPNAAELRKWIGRALALHNKLVPVEQAVEGLAGVWGNHVILRERDSLRTQEGIARMELNEMLSGARLSPRQYTIMNLHYLQYYSWTKIADRLQIERRYALQVHIQAIERLSEQFEAPPVLQKRTVG
ncbi:MAG: hypothetical protein PHR24_04030 [Oscillospiraceae bacterium]|nr:hypothetical protein [Oscillospiraceae bacterium]MDD4546442.1 hypothetical protein [Oscillospiraceae bacterium]